MALNIPFIKILGLPKRGQNEVHDPVVCVPSDLKNVTATLPRPEDESNFNESQIKEKVDI